MCSFNRPVTGLYAFASITYYYEGWGDTVTPFAIDCELLHAIRVTTVTRWRSMVGDCWQWLAMEVTKVIRLIAMVDNWLAIALSFLDAPLTQSEMRTRGIFTAPTVCNDRMPVCECCRHRSNICCLCMSSVSSFAPLC